MACALFTWQVKLRTSCCYPLLFEHSNISCYDGLLVGGEEKEREIEREREMAGERKEIYRE